MDARYVNCVKIRWFNDACYELKLPNGKGILIDPYIDHSENKLLDSSAVEAADYMVVSHTHFDHTMNIGDLSEKFDSEIFVGQNAVVPLAEYFDIPGYRLTPCYPGETYYTEDFKLECFWAKHIKLGTFDVPSIWTSGQFEKEKLPTEMSALNTIGSYEYTNYIITLKNKLRIMIWGGGVTVDALKRVKQYDVDIAIVQFPRNTPEQIITMCNAISPQVIFPHHHECFESVMGLDMDECIRVIQDGVAKSSPDTLVVNPVKGKWYDLKLSVLLEE